MNYLNEITDYQYFNSEVFQESGRSKKLKPSEIHDCDKELREMIRSMSEVDRDHIGYGYWIENKEKVLYRRIIKEDGEIVGFIDVYGRLPKIPGNQGCVVLAIAKGSRGKGYGKRLAKRLVHDFKKGQIKVENLRWLVDKGNDVSAKLATSVGFELVKKTKFESEYKLFREYEESFYYEDGEETDDQPDEESKEIEDSLEPANEDENDAPPEDPMEEEIPEEQTEEPKADTIDQTQPSETLPTQPTPQPTTNVPKEEPKKQSFPKQIDSEEKDKNGVRRKKLYIAFIEWAKEFNPKNTFGSVFDKDVFHNTYPFVPHDMRYFYRLANPILCVLSGHLTFFQLSELKKLNAQNKQLADMMIFAATDKDVRVFSNKDLKVYLGTVQNDKIKLSRVLGNTFDTYLQSMIKKGDILNGPIEEENSDE